MVLKWGEAVRPKAELARGEQFSNNFSTYKLKKKIQLLTFKVLFNE